MSEKLEVKLSGVDCAVITQSQDGNLSLDYLESYSTVQAPISLSMPIGFFGFPKKIVLPFLQGLLPDNDNAIRALATRFGVNERNPFSLLKHIGQDVAGALEFLSFEAEINRQVRPAKSFTDSDIEDLLREKVNQYEDGTLGDSAANNLSLAGAQPKLVLHKSQDGNWLEPNGKNISTHIIKPVPSRWRNLDIVEHLTMLAAKYLGLKVANTELFYFGSSPVFITQRYDREVDIMGNVRRIHQEDLCQALSVPPAKKYQYRDGGPGVGSIAILFRQTVAPAYQEELSQEFFKGLVFNVAARCTDAHAKNFSLLLEGSSVKLAPLYDLASTVLYGLPPKSAMSINGKYGFSEIGTQDFLVEAKRLKLDLDWSEEQIKQIDNNVVEAFAQARKEILNSTDQKQAKETTKELVEALRNSRS